MKQRKMYDDQFKAKVALEAVKGEKTIAEIEVAGSSNAPRLHIVNCDIVLIQ